MELVTPITSADIELTAALPGLGRLVADRVVSVRSTAAMAALGGVPLDDDLPVIALVRPSTDRVDPDGTGYGPVLGRHGHQGDKSAWLQPGTANVCTVCVLEVLLDIHPTLSDTELQGLLSLTVASGLLQPEAPVVSVGILEWSLAVRQAT